jgi:hypothetical protein
MTISPCRERRAEGVIQAVRGKVKFISFGAMDVGTGLLAKMRPTARDLLKIQEGFTRSAG